MSFNEWSDKEGLGKYARRNFELWMKEHGYHPDTLRSESEWQALWDKFVNGALC